MYNLEIFALFNLICFVSYNMYIIDSKPLCPHEYVTV